MIVAPKTDKSRRTLCMPSLVAEALKKHREESVIELPQQFVCCVSTGEALSLNTFTRRFKLALKNAGLSQNIRFHDLRHSAAALMTAAGANPKEVSDYLGHSSISISMDLYADIFELSKQETAKKLDELMKPYLKG